MENKFDFNQLIKELKDIKYAGRDKKCKIDELLKKINDLPSEAFSMKTNEDKSLLHIALYERDWNSPSFLSDPYKPVLIKLIEKTPREIFNSHDKLATVVWFNEISYGLNTPLHIACFNAEYDIAKMVLEKTSGEVLKKENAFSRTPRNIVENGLNIVKDSRRKNSLSKILIILDEKEKRLEQANELAKKMSFKHSNISPSYRMY